MRRGHEGQRKRIMGTESGGGQNILRKIEHPSFCEELECCQLASWWVGSSIAGVAYCFGHTVALMQEGRTTRSAEKQDPMFIALLEFLIQEKGESDPWVDHGPPSLVLNAGLPYSCWRPKEGRSQAVG